MWLYLLFREPPVAPALRSLWLENKDGLPFLGRFVGGGSENGTIKSKGKNTEKQWDESGSFFQGRCQQKTLKIKLTYINSLHLKQPWKRILSISRHFVQPGRCCGYQLSRVFLGIFVKNQDFLPEICPPIWNGSNLTYRTLLVCWIVCSLDSMAQQSVRGKFALGKLCLGVLATIGPWPPVNELDADGVSWLVWLWI